MTPDIIVFSDGSGFHKDSFGGWSAIATTPDRIWKLFRWGSMVGTSVDRMEMTAMLEGLQMAVEIADVLPKKSLKKIKSKVHIYTDRENMVLSIKNVYSRSNSPDLWARFEVYEKILDITATHVDRETDFPEFVQVDLHSSSGRIHAKGYYESVSELVAKPILEFDFNHDNEKRI